jgi:ribosome-associated toxin RatA of RatAB toxin-antitoxin module
MNRLLPRHLLLIVLPTLLSATPAQAESHGATPQIDVRLHKVDGQPTFEVHAAITVNAGQERSWEVLTGYDRLAQFVPNLSDSHVVARDGNSVIVIQTGYAKFLFIRQPVELRLQVTEQAMQRIDIHRLGGSMLSYEAHWELQPLADGRTRLAYDGIITPDFYVPALFGPALMRSDLRSMLEAVRSEIDKP